jgi:hypothetical protein
MSEERIQKLNDIGFEWSIMVTLDWDERFKQLKAFKNEHGHCRVLGREGKDSKIKQLALWVTRQRVQHKLFQQGKKSYLKEERIQKLNEVGMWWGSTVTFDWDERLEQLRVFQDEQGHCRVPQSKDTHTYQLALWVRMQQKEYQLSQQGKKSQITQERIQKLNGVDCSGLVRPERVSWGERFEALKAFKQKHGHCRVLKSRLNSKTNQLNSKTNQLANLVMNQRRLYMEVRLGKKPRCCDERIQKLNEIGFDW